MRAELVVLLIASIVVTGCGDRRGLGTSVTARDAISESDGRQSWADSNRIGDSVADSEDASPVPDVSIGAELHVFTDGNGALDGVPISPPDATDGQDAVDESEVSDTADRFDVGSISDSSDAPAVTQVPDGSPIIDTSGDDALPVVDASDALVVVDAPDGDPIDVVHVDLGSDSDHAVD